MATLTNTKIKDTYDGLLKTTNAEAIGASGVTLIEDGLGNASAISIGRSGNGVTITGSLNATLATAAQPNITSVGTLSSLAVTGNLTVDTNTLYVDAANNRVGIGTSTLSYPFEVNGFSRFTNGFYLNEATAGTNAAIYLGNNQTLELESFGTNGEIAFSTGSSISEAMRIDSSGNVGVGVVPSAWSFTALQVKNSSFWSTGGDLGINTNSYYDGSTYRYISNGVASRVYHNTDGSFAWSNTDSGNAGDSINTFYERMRIDSSGQIITGGDINLGNETSGRKVLNINSGDNGAAIVFRADAVTRARIEVPDGETSLVFGVESASTPSERMRITSGGYLKASNTGSYENAAGSFHEFVNDVANVPNSIFRFTNGTDAYGILLRFAAYSPNDTTHYFIEGVDTTSTRFRIYSNGNIVNTNNSYGAISDAKLKENIVDASPKLDDLLQVKVRNYNLIGDDKKQLGVVAQELEEVFPSMIDESPDFEEQEVIDEEGNVTKERVDLGTTTKSVKYSVFVPMLIKAIQELNAKVESLESQLNAQ